MEWYEIIAIVIVVIAVVLLLVFLWVGLAMKKLFHTHANRNPGENPSGFDDIMGDDYKEAWAMGEIVGGEFVKNIPTQISVKTHEGLILRGEFYKSLNTNAKQTVICAHGFRSSGIWDFATLSMFFINNFNVIFINHRGHNESDGNEICFGQKSCYDINLWIEKALEITPDCDIILHGVSMGGATLLMASDKINSDKVKFIVSDCAFSDGGAEMEYMVKYSKYPTFPTTFFCKVWFNWLNKIKMDAQKPIECVKNAKVPILFIHGKNDKFVPFYMGERLYDICKNEKDFLWVDGAGHGMSYFKNKDEYESKYLDFVKRFCN